MTTNLPTNARRMLSGRERALILHRHALHCKYEKAVALYADTDMPMKDIATTKQRYAQALELYRNTTLTMKEIVRRTGVPAEGFRFYLHKWHKDLVIERLGISSNVSGHTDLRKARKRMKTVAAKYEKAIKSLRTNPRPVSVVATEFGFHPEVFRDYLHKHEPELARQQGMMKTANGKIVSRRSEEKYAEAVRLYGTTTETLKSIAARLGLTYNSVSGYIRRNYPEVIARHQNLLRTRFADS